MAQQRISLAVMLLMAAASLVSVQLPPLASSAALPQFPKIKSYATRARAEQIMKKLDGFFQRHGDDAVEKLLPPPAPPVVNVRQLDSSPAEGAVLYSVDLAVGTPAQTISGVMDISTQLVWMQCDPCTACLPPPASTFKPRDSANFSAFKCSSKTCKDALGPSCAGNNDPCEYSAIYANSTATTGYLAADTFTFGTTAVQRMVFGCSHRSVGVYSGASGIIGFGRGQLSLVSQLSLSNFSYFLAPQDSRRDNEIQLGDVAVPQTDRSRSTRLHKSSKHSDLYYVALTGIKVDGQVLNDIPLGTFDLREDGSGGVFLSTTVPVTYLQKDAYNVLRRAFVSRIQPKPVDAPNLGLDLCYTAKSMAGTNIPRLTLVFDGVDAAMELGSANYFFKFKDGATELQCLAVLPSRDASLLGSLLQTGTKMIYDLDGEQLTFVMEDSPRLSQAPHSQAASLIIIIVVVPVAVWMLMF